MKYYPYPVGFNSEFSMGPPILGLHYGYLATGTPWGPLSGTPYMERDSKVVTPLWIPCNLGFGLPLPEHVAMHYVII